MNLKPPRSPATCAGWRSIRCRGSRGTARSRCCSTKTTASQQVRLHIVEFRGFEKFIQGRPYWEVPVMVQRLCGICPVSHHLAAAKAMDMIVGGKLTPTAEKVRRLMHYGQILQSHALHFFHLARRTCCSASTPRWRAGTWSRLPPQAARSGEKGRAAAQVRAGSDPCHRRQARARHRRDPRRREQSTDRRRTRLPAGGLLPRGGLVARGGRHRPSAQRLEPAAVRRLRRLPLEHALHRRAGRLARSVRRQPRARDADGEILLDRGDCSATGS